MWQTLDAPFYSRPRPRDTIKLPSKPGLLWEHHLIDGDALRRCLPFHHLRRNGACMSTRAHHFFAMPTMHALDVCMDVPDVLHCGFFDQDNTRKLPAPASNRIKETDRHPAVLDECVCSAPWTQPMHAKRASMQRPQKVSSKEGAAPGSTLLTRTPLGANSSARPRVMASCAALATL